MNELPHVNFDGVLVERAAPEPSVFDPDPAADPREWYNRRTVVNFNPPPPKRPFIRPKCEALPYQPNPAPPPKYSGDTTYERIDPEPVANPVIAAAHRLFRPGKVRQVARPEPPIKR